MRLKIRHPYYTYKLVHVRQTRLFTNENCKPVISFRVDKKYELDLANYAVIFTDQKGKEVFRTSRLKLQYRYYEEGEHGRKEVKFETEPLEFEDYGEVAIPFARKVFKTISNKKKPAPPKPEPIKPSTSLYRYPVWLMRTMEKIMAERRQAQYARFIERKRFISKNIQPIALSYEIISRAPT